MNGTILYWIGGIVIAAIAVKVFLVLKHEHESIATKSIDRISRNNGILKG